MTEVAGYTQTAAVTTGTSTPAPQTPLPVGTQTALPLLSEPTAVINNPSCPVETFETDDLDPVWRLSCSHCLPDEAESDNPMDVWLRERSTAVSGVNFATLPPFEFSTFTPTPSGSEMPTFTPTAVFTPTTPPCWVPYNLGGDLWQLSIDFDGCPYPVEVQTNATVVNGYLMVVGGDLWLEVSMPVSSHHLDGFSAYFAADGGASRGVYWQVHSTVTGWSALTLLGSFPSSTWYWNYVRPWGGGGVENIDKVYFNVQTNTHAQTTYLNDFQLNFFGAYATPTPNVTNTPTNTPTPTGTLEPSSTPTPNWLQGHSVLPFADCSVPRYSQPDAPIMDMDIGNLQEGQCFVLLPPIDHPAGIDLEIAEHQVCFYPFALNIQILGMSIDMTVLLAAPAFFFIMRWMLRN